MNKNFKKYLDEVHKWREEIYQEEKGVKKQEIIKKYQDIRKHANLKTAKFLE